MASGTRKRYALDLDDIMSFPNADTLPVFPPKEGESWIMLMEITADRSLLRPVYAVRDVTQAKFLVALHTPNPREDAQNFKVGHTLCITATRARPPQYLGGHGQIGYRIEDPSTIQILPVSLAGLWEINASLKERSDRGNLLKCNLCNSTCKSGCGTCKARYCSKECQRSDWPQHKRKCVVMRALHGWTRTDFG